MQADRWSGKGCIIDGAYRQATDVGSVVSTFVDTDNSKTLTTRIEIIYSDIQRAGITWFLPTWDYEV